MERDLQPIIETCSICGRHWDILQLRYDIPTGKHICKDCFTDWIDDQDNTEFGITGFSR